MTSRDNIACKWFERVWNGNDEAAIAELAAPDMKAHGADGVTRTPETFPEFQRAILAALPDMRIEIPLCVEGRDMVAVHWVAKGTHTGSAPGIPAGKGTPITVSGLTLVRLAGGKIVEGWDDYDFAGLMRQLGAAV
jgi:predicted ester cyclase